MNLPPALGRGFRGAVLAWSVVAWAPASSWASGSGTPPPLLTFAAGLPGKQVKLSWAAQPGVRYAVERSTGLSSDGSGGGGGGWIRVALVDGDGPTAEWRDPEAVASQCFYRVTVPQAEVFEADPPLLGMTGGTITLHAQLLPAGSSLSLEIQGLGVVSAPLVAGAPGTWTASFGGTFFPPGTIVISAIVVDSGGALVTSVPQVISITPSGRALDAPPALPPAAPLGVQTIDPFTFGLSDDCDDRDPAIAARLAIKTKGLPVQRTASPSLAIKTKGLPVQRTIAGSLGTAAPGIPSLPGLPPIMGMAINEKGLPGEKKPVKKKTNSAARSAPPAGGSVGVSPSTGEALRMAINEKGPPATPRKDKGSSHRLMSGSGSPASWTPQPGIMGMAINEKGLPGEKKPVKKKPHSSARTLPPSSGMPGEVVFAYEALSCPTPAGPPLAWVMTYRSARSMSSAQGPQWDFSYNIGIEPVLAADGVTIERVWLSNGAGCKDPLRLMPDGSYRCDGMMRTGSFTGNVFTLSFADQGKWVFHPLDGSPAAGKIDSIVDRNGVALGCAYDSAGRLASVSDAFGNGITVNWDPASSTPRIASLATLKGKIVLFGGYAAGEQGGSEGDLKSISCPMLPGTPPEANPIEFTYSKGAQDPNLDHNLLSVRDGEGRVLKSFTYSSVPDPRSPAYDRCASFTVDGHASMLIWSPRSNIGYTCYSVDAVGRLTEFDFDNQHRVTEARRFTGYCTPGVPADATTNRPTGKLRATDPDYYASSFKWNRDHSLVRVTAPDGSSVECQHEREFNSTCPSTLAGNVRAVTLRSTGGETRTVSFQYLPGFGTLERKANAGPGTSISVSVAVDDDDCDGRVLATHDDYDAFCPSDDSDRSADFVTADDTDLFAVSDDGDCDDARFATADDSDCDDTSDTYAALAKADGIPNYLDLDSDNDAASDDFAFVMMDDQDCDEFSLNDDCDDTSSDLRVSIPPLTRIVTAHGQSFSLSYDAHANPTQITTPVSGQGSSWDYDTQGRCVSYSLANGTTPITTDFSYDPASGLPATVVQDPGGLGIKTSLEYNTHGDCVRVVDALGNDCTFEYTPAGRLKRCESPPVAGHRIATDFLRDHAGRLVRRDTEHRAADGSPVAGNPAYSTFFVRDGVARLTRIADEERPVAATTETTPDSLGIANFAVLDFTYNAGGEVIRMSTPAACRGATSDLACDFQFDERGRLYQKIAGGGGSVGAVTTRYDYHPSGQLQRITSLGGSAGNPETNYAYDGFHRLASVTDPMGNQRVYLYGGRGEITQEVYGETEDVPGSTGNVLLKRKQIAAAWILLGQRYCACPPSLFHGWVNKDDTIICDHFTPGSGLPAVQETTVVVRSVSGLKEEIRENDTVVFTCSHDGAGRLSSISNGACSVALTRDSVGQVLFCGETDHFRVGNLPPKLFSTTFTYDALQRMSSSTDGAGNTRSYAYDSYGRCTAATSPRGLVMNCEFDGGTAVGPFSSRLSCDLNGDGIPDVVAASLSRCGELLSKTDTLGFSALCQWDSSGRLVRRDYADGTFETVGYNALGLPNHMVQVDGTVRETSFDANCRVLNVIHINNPPLLDAVAPLSFTYDGIGHGTRREQGSSVIVRGWDSKGKMVSETNGQRSVTYSYNQRGRTGMQVVSGGTATLRQAETRDALGRLLSVSLVNAAGVPVSPPVASFEHLGMTVCKTTQANGVVSTYDFRGDGDAANPGDSSYGLLATRCRVRAQNNELLLDASYSRDPDYRLSSQVTTYGPGSSAVLRTSTWTHDLLGRITASTVTRNDGGGLPPVTELDVAYQLNARGERVLVSGGNNAGSYVQTPADAARGLYTEWPGGTLAWDACRNLTSILYGKEGSRVLRYDAMGRLVAVRDGSTSAPFAEFTYDACGRLDTTTTYSGGVPSFTRFVYDGGTCVQELGSDGLPTLTLVAADGVHYAMRTNHTAVYYPQGSLRVAGDNTPIVRGTALGGLNTDPSGIYQMFTSSAGTVLNYRTCTCDSGYIALGTDGRPSSSGIGPIRWMAPEALNLEESRMIHAGSSAYSPALGMVVAKEKQPRPHTQGHVQVGGAQ